MNDFEKAVFVDYIMRNLDTVSNPEIASVMFLQLGYHSNYQVTPPSNRWVAYDLAPNIDDDGKTANQTVVQTIVPNIAQGVYSSQNNGLFSMDLSEDDGCPYGVREQSIQSLTNAVPHIFEMDVYETSEDQMSVSKTKKEKLKVAFYDKTGMPITLSHMMSQTSLVPPPTPAGTSLGSLGP